MKNYKLYVGVCIISLLLTANLNAKEIYQWVDEKGTLHFQSSPPQNTKQPVTIKRLPTYKDTYRDSESSVPEQEKENPGSETTASEASPKPEVELFVTSWCPHCRKTVEFLKENKIAFNYIDIEAQPDDVVAKVVEVNGGFDWVVPTFEFNGKWRKGKVFDPRELTKDLVEMGVIKE